MTDPREALTVHLLAQLGEPAVVVIMKGVTVEEPPADLLLFVTEDLAHLPTPKLCWLLKAVANEFNRREALASQATRQ